MAPGWLAIGTHEFACARRATARHAASRSSTPTWPHPDHVNNNGMLAAGVEHDARRLASAEFDLADMNCDGQADLVYSLTTRPRSAWFVRRRCGG